MMLMLTLVVIVTVAIHTIHVFLSISTPIFLVLRSFLMTMNEEELFLSLYQRLLLQGHLPENEIENEVHMIMDNPEKYKWHFIFDIFDR